MEIYIGTAVLSRLRCLWIAIRIKFESTHTNSFASSRYLQLLASEATLDNSHSHRFILSKCQRWKSYVVSMEQGIKKTQHFSEVFCLIRLRFIQLKNQTVHDQNSFPALSSKSTWTVLLLFRLWISFPFSSSALKWTTTTAFPSILGTNHTCELADGIGLPVVLAQVGVNKVHHIRANGRLEHRRQGDILAGCFPLFRVDRYQRSSASLKKKRKSS